MKNVPANARDKGDTHLTSGPGWSHGEEKDNTFQYFSWIIPWTQEPGGTQSTISKKNQTWLNTSNISRKEHFSAILFSRSVMSDSLQPHASQHASPPYPLPTPGVYPTHVHQVGDVIQPSHPLSSPFPPAFNLSQHQGLFKWVSFEKWGSLLQVAQVLEFQLQHQSFQWIFRIDFL